LLVGAVLAAKPAPWLARTQMNVVPVKSKPAALDTKVQEHTTVLFDATAPVSERLLKSGLFPRK
jgi:hypothetical protein